MARARLRDLGITIGKIPPGGNNAITDVQGVWVGHHSLVYNEPRCARTGVTVILPRQDTSREDHVFAGFHALNGNGEMTGLLWVEESGMLGSPIALTNTSQVGIVRDALTEYTVREHGGSGFRLPVVAETWDGWLNDIDAFHLDKGHVFEAIAEARPGPVPEGNVGGGTGMICHDFKGGIGTASRLVACESGQFTVGALVQANHGERGDLRVDGLPVGREIGLELVPSPWEDMQSSSSIVVIIATDAPLLPVQCKRLAQRATIGMARAGGIGHNGSGDLFLAFATGNQLPAKAGCTLPLAMIPHHHLNPFFYAVAESVEEAILNAMTAAETMLGYQGHTAHELPLDLLQQVMAKYQV